MDRRSPDPVLRYRGPERRSDADRRARQATLLRSLEGGWLTFESEAEKRRLVPIPAGWEQLPDPELERLRVLARPVPKTIFQQPAHEMMGT